MSERSWSNFEHQVYRELKDLSLNGKKCLLMVSGGADSVALVAILSRLRPALHCQYEILHCHHGPADAQQLAYRDQAEKFVESLAVKFQIPFHLARSQEQLHSEEEFRKFRKAQAQKISKSQNCNLIVWGHQQDDFLETQILRLIRGAGPQSVLAPMSVAKGEDLRPLLHCSRSEIIAYLRDQNIEWLEDPSNSDESYLRNWLRNRWLPDLEAKCPGALKVFSRSLGLIQESMNETFPEEIWVDGGLSRPLFLTLSEAQKRQVLALYLRQLGQKEFTHNQIKEIIKHLDIAQLNHTFRAVHLDWSLSKDVINANSPSVVNAF